MKNYTLSGAFTFLNFLTNLIIYSQEYPEKLKDNTKIISVFGSINNMIWSGGRYVLLHLDLNLIEQIINQYNNFNIGVNLTLSNVYLKEKHLQDKTCNDILTILNKNKLNSVILISDLLKNHIQENYTNVSIKHSCVHCEKDIYYYINKEPYYDLLVLDPDLNRDFEQLKKIQNRHKYEILVNEKCVPNCPIRKAHYKIISDEILKQKSEDELQFECYKHIDPSGHGKLVLNYNEVNKLHNMGFENFKLVGRTENLGLTNVMYEYAHYLIKEDYYLDFFFKVIEPILFEINFINNQRG